LFCLEVLCEVLLEEIVEQVIAPFVEARQCSLCSGENTARDQIYYLGHFQCCKQVYITYCYRTVFGAPCHYSGVYRKRVVDLLCAARSKAPECVHCLLDKLGYAPYCAYLEALRVWNKESADLLSNCTFIESLRAWENPEQVSMSLCHETLRNMLMSIVIERMLPFVFDKKAHRHVIYDYCKTVPQIASVHFAKTSTLPSCPLYYACLFSSPHKGYELDVRSFVDAVVSKQGKRMDKESDGLPSLDSLDVMFFTLLCALVTLKWYKKLFVAQTEKTFLCHG
jgi:hypothetical protein